MAEEAGAAATGFLHKLLTGRWLMLFASLIIMAMNGSGYMFGLYSNHIKSIFGYDQSALNSISFFKDLGANLGVVSGLLYEVAPPWLVLSVGAILNFFGYFMLWLAVSGRTAAPGLWLMCVYMGVAANSLSFGNTAALVTCLRNFPLHRGCLLGLLKGYIGLSGAIMTQLYHAMYGENNPEGLILMIAWLPSAISLASLPFIRHINSNNNQRNDLKPFYNLLYISLALAASLLAIIIPQTKIHFSKTDYIAVASLVILFLLLPLAIVVNQELTLHNHPPPITSILVQSSSPHLTTMSRSSNWYKNIFTGRPVFGDDHTILQAILSVDMAILFMATTCGVGGVLTVVDNVAQIGASLDYPTRSISSFVSLMSIWNFLGRVMAGYVSEFLLMKYRFPRPLMLTFVILLSCIGHIMIAFGVPNSLYFVSIITGFCLGAQLPLTATIISDLFGLKHYSTLYNVGSVSSPVGSYIFNVRVAGRVYDREGERQRNFAFCNFGA
ncbi:protein NUCLEAR FUSION DEFECTIVE 4-like [Cucumis melo var. makuwa]|uniref:Protein NUCLEAR FUSION DEFECTIVE 4-like n=1 Tax=Cucumis melo var. makuwa TaxID=1194695 RepID=A0A5D3C4Y9_CUCMM|nr:protein NUCLEAR FUSION DEFECTIVE 4-like [Cucumis melo var. makuwa]